MEDVAHSLKRGSLTWSRAAALGISISIAGSFAGWNYGLGPGGWGGMAIAVLATGLLFFCLTQAVAELSAAMPSSAGFDSYVGAVLGPTAGFLSGVSVALGLAVGTGLAVSFTAAYTEGMLGIGGWPVKASLLGVVFLLHMRGAKEAVGLTMAVGAIALFVLVCFCLFMAPHFATEHLYTPAARGRTLFPGGLLGVIQCVPFALFMFLGVEQAAQAAAEVQDPARSMPRALFTAVLVTFIVSLAVLLIATAASSALGLAGADDPLLFVIHAQAAGPLQAALGHIIGAGALISFMAAFFSLAFGSSRQFYHLASSGALPSWISRTNRRGAPVAALGIVALVGAVTAAFPPENAMVVFVFLLLITYELILIAFLRFQSAAPDVARPYRAAGGGVLGWVGAILGLAAAMCCYQLEMIALSYALGALGVLLVYFLLRKRSSVNLKPV